ncbi:MAG: YidC/Oxa1 family membrane protein insertase [bacterium]
MGLTEIFLYFLEFSNRFTHNYGWDIIILTVLIRVLIFPLTLSSTRSMAAMQKIQPRLKELQAKYRGDKERLHKEMMALYKEAGVNPLSGCLPLVIQLPIFIVLFRILRIPEANGYMFVNATFYGMDLMTAAFNRLSGDFLSGLSLLLPGMVNLSILGEWGIGFFHQSYLYLPTLVLVVFMSVTTIVQQKMMMMDTAQSSQMMMFNVFIVVISFTMPAGVLLYWGVSNFLQLAQQKFMSQQKSVAGGVKTVGGGRSGEKRAVEGAGGDGKAAGAAGGRAHDMGAAKKGGEHVKAGGAGKNTGKGKKKKRKKRKKKKR